MRKFDNILAVHSDKWHVDEETQCFLWDGAINPETGYAVARFESKTVNVHRQVAKEYRGPIPRGLDASHTCDTRHCVNPHHIVLETRSENLLRRSPEKAHRDVGRQSGYAS